MPQTKHTETSILQTYLLIPSSLPTIIPYRAFLDLVPTQHRSNPHLKRLYRDLQFQRTIDVDTVRQNIENEVAKSIVLKTQLAQRIANEQGREITNNDGQKTKKRKREAAADEFNNAVDVVIDTTYFTTTLHPAHTNPSLPASANHPLTAATQKYHTTTSLVTALDSACSAMETEIADLETESARLLAEMDEIVGSLSDLRYGRFAKPVGSDAGGGQRTVEEEVVDVLKGFEARMEEALG